MGGDSYNEKLDALNSQFAAVLDDFKKFFIFYYKNPDYADYKTSYNQAKSTIQGINSQLFQIVSEVEAALSAMAEDTTKINNGITEEKDTQDKLNSNLASIKSTNRSSNTMIQNYKDGYKDQFAKNIIMFLAIFLSLYVIFKVYKK